MPTSPRRKSVPTRRTTTSPRPGGPRACASSGTTDSASQIRAVGDRAVGGESASRPRHNRRPGAAVTAASGAARRRGRTGRNAGTSGPRARSRRTGSRSRPRSDRSTGVGRGRRASCRPPGCSWAVTATTTMPINGVTPLAGVTPQAVAAAGADGGLVQAVLLGVDDGVVAADAVGLEGLGGWVVVPAATLGEVAERESAPARQGHHGAAGAVTAWPQRVGEGVPVVEVADHRDVASDRVGRQSEVDLDGLTAFDGCLLDHWHSPFGVTGRTVQDVGTRAAALEPSVERRRPSGGLG